MTDVPVYLSPKRKRGRPRKDCNLFRENSFKKLSNPNIRKTLNAYKDGNNTAEGMVGRMVYGVIEGSFDAGYLISVRTSNNCTPFRGVVFQSEKVVLVTPTNDIAPKVKMYQRREIPVPPYNLPSQFNGVSPILPCGPHTSIAPFKFTNHSTLSVTEPTLPQLGLCSNAGGNNEPSSAFAIDSHWIMKPDELIFGLNMNDVVKTGQMVSEPSFESMFNNFVGNGVKSEPGSGFLMRDKLQGSNVELHHNSAPQSEFETQQNAMYHSEMNNNNLGLNFHQNMFTYQEQLNCPESNFHQVNFNEGVSMSPNLKLHLASVTQEKKSSREPESSNARIESKYLGSNPFLQGPERESNLSLKSVLEAGERFHDEDRTSMAEAGAPGSGLKEESLFKLELATVQSPLERCVKQTGSFTDSITEMDYILSDVVPLAESHGHFWKTKFT